MTEPSRPQLPAIIRRPLINAVIGVALFATGFGLWAVFAPLATTITLQGSIVSSEPAIALQHPYGGPVREVLVNAHDTVEVGQPLLTFDIAREREALAAQVSMRDRLMAENAAITRLLDGPIAADVSVPFTEKSPLDVRRKQVDAQRQATEESVTLLEQQIDTLDTKIGYSKAQLGLMNTRADRVEYLSNQGLTLVSDGERLQEQILIVRGEISSDQAAIVELKNQIARMRQQQSQAEIALEHELRATRQRNLERLDDLKGAIINLTDQVEKSIVRAPISGVVDSIPIEAEHMFAARGATLLTLARPMQRAQVTFTVPVDQIDQVHPGMTAQVVIPSIPQRQMPKMELRIEAISPRARHDETDRPVSFSGLAHGEAGLFDELRERIGLDALSEDMPVLLHVSVRQTTFADYLFTPLSRAFSTALQD
ncbi:MAG: HlyD family efflux transporter periplasmic adaptor subunit [Pseudomonadota bacterium]